MANKICKLCSKEIDTGKESYVRLTDYKGGKFLTEGYYHNSCYHAQIQNAVMFNKKKLLARMKGMFPGIGKQLKETMQDDK